MPNIVCILSLICIIILNLREKIIIPHFTGSLNYPFIYVHMYTHMCVCVLHLLCDKQQSLYFAPSMITTYKGCSPGGAYIPMRRDRRETANIIYTTCVSHIAC